MTRTSWTLAPTLQQLRLDRVATWATQRCAFCEIRIEPVHVELADGRSWHECPLCTFVQPDPPQLGQ